MSKAEEKLLKALGLPYEPKKEEPLSGITLDGVPLKEIVKEETGNQAVQVANQTAWELSQQTKKVQGSRYKGVGSGRGPGKPKGLKRARVYSEEEIAELNRKKGGES